MNEAIQLTHKCSGNNISKGMREPAKITYHYSNIGEIVELVVYCVSENVGVYASFKWDKPTRLSQIFWITLHQKRT